MKKLFFIPLLMFLGSCGGEQVAISTSKAEIQEKIVKVADWQLSHVSLNRSVPIPSTDWAYAPFINGLYAISKLPGNSSYRDAIVSKGEEVQWTPITTIHPANDHATPQTWIEMFEESGDSVMLINTQKFADEFMEKCDASNNDLRFIPENFHKWSWCDALYMSPPLFARLAKVTGDSKYLDFMHRWWREVSDVYYDTEYKLFYRDHNEKAKREANGKPVFWLRGEGWVAGGLARVLQYLPKDDANYNFYTTQFVDICTSLLAQQQDNGLWVPGVLDPEAWTNPETSGSGLVVYAMAWGVNNGILDKDTFMPAIAKSWNSLQTFVEEDGKFVGVQPIGDSPVSYNASSTLPYGAGAFLLAASEVYVLAK